MEGLTAPHALDVLQKMTRLLLLLIGLLSLPGCDRSAVPATESEPRSDEVKGNIRFALANYIFENNASGGQQNVEYYFLAIDGGDPSEEFIARFANRKPIVLPSSLAVASADKGVLHKETKKRGLIFSIDDIEWVSDTEVKVSWGYYEAGLSASGNTATLQLEGKEWKVTGDQMHWISKRMQNKTRLDNPLPRRELT